MGDAAADRTPGDESSLHALYVAVPSTEELDLADELAPSPESPAIYVPPPDDDATPEDVDEPEDELTPLTDGQARGVLEQLLGAERVEEEPEDEE